MSALPEPFDSSDELQARLRGVLYVAEALASNLRELRGCEVDRDQMIAVAELIGRELRVVLDAGPILPSEASAEGVGA